MTGEKLFCAIGLISDEKIAEADATTIKMKSTKITRLRLVTITVAACLIIAITIFGIMSVSSKDNAEITANSSQPQGVESPRFMPASINAFSLAVYTVETQANGSFGTREVEEAVLIERERVQYHKYPLRLGYMSYADGIYYSSVGLVCRGENIASVSISVDQGFLGKNSISELTKYDATHSEATTGFTSESIVNIGNHLTLRSDEITDDLLLCWGMDDVSSADDLPWEVVIRAVAIFEDGTSAEQTILFDLLVAIVELKDLEQSAIMYNESRDYYAGLLLEDCELVPDSVRPFTGTYEYSICEDSLRNSNKTVSISLGDWIDDDAYFDENGLRMIDWGDSYGDDERGFIVIVKRADDGSMTCMIYRTPPRIP